MMSRSRSGLALLALALACAPKAGTGGGEQSPPPIATAGPQPPTITLMLDREALGVPVSAPIDSLRRVIDRAVLGLQQEVPFEVLANSPPLLTLQVRARTAEETAALLASLRRAPTVFRADVATTTVSIHPDSQVVRGTPAPGAPVFLVTLHADSLGIRPGQSPGQIAALVTQALPSLRQTYDFELLEQLTPLPILKVRPWLGANPVDLTVRLGLHPWVRAVEPDHFMVDSVPGASLTR